VPLIDTVHDHLAVEIMRGCPQGCRFCMAGPIYRPVRVRPEQEILDQIETQIRNTGYSEVALMSLSTSDYPNIDRLATAVARRLESRRAAISLPTMRPGTISPALLDAVSRVRKSGLTIAPEAGTERLRLFVRKNFPDAAIYDTVRLAYARGWMTIKLYFMVGLPTETDEDLLGIAAMIKNIAEIGRDYPGKKSINVTLSPFVPKPHTPFQWDAQEAPEEMLRRINFVKRHVRLNNVSFKHSGLESVFLQGVIGRGDRRLGPVIAAAYAKGCRFDSWSEHLQADKWWEAFKENGVDIRELLKPIPFSAALPWSHIGKGVPDEHLRQERERTSMVLRDFVPLAAAGDNAATGELQLEYGRGKKKVVVRNASAPTKNRLRVRWGKSARYKYMSHLDNLRLIERLIRRSGVPVAYSQGFNPTMKLSLGPPLPLGYTSEAEYVDITLEANLMAYMVDNLRKAMPDGITLLDARAVASGLQSLSAAVNRMVYTLPLEQVSASADSIDSGITAILKAEVIEIERVGKTETKKTDIRPGIYDLHVDAGVLSMTLGIGEGGYVRPAEVMTLILGTQPEEIHTYAFHRKAVWRVDESGRTIDGMDV
jgi:radical SAM-linked protein